MFYALLPGGGLAFASEPRALALHPDVECEIDPMALAHYMRLNYVPCNRTLFAGVQSLPRPVTGSSDSGVDSESYDTGTCVEVP